VVEVGVVAVVSFIAALLTFFSGFGLGTLLLPAFALFFPVEFAVFGAALVHVANTLFKWSMTHRYLPWKQLKWFLLAAIPASAAGAYGVGLLPNIPFYTFYRTNGIAEVTVFDVLVSLVLLALVVNAFISSDKAGPTHFSIPQWVGGLISGFLGGLTGMQGAVRSAFLHHLSLSKEAFVAAGTLVALCVDLVRIPVYMTQQDFQGAFVALRDPLFAGIAAAILGSYIGRKLLSKITNRVFTIIVGIMLGLFAVSLLLGVVP
jgi:hypothetical protein